MKNALIAIATCAALLMPGQALAGGSQPPKIGTKYPIVLAHGAPGFDMLLGIEYFYKIAGELKNQGHQVFVTEVSTLNTPVVRGNQLADQIEQILAITGKQKVIVIAHSTGGLDARYATRFRLGADKVAAVVTVATPHRGSSFADQIGAIFAGGDGMPSGDLGLAMMTFLNWIGAALNGNGQLPQDAAAALFYMAPAGAAVFNAQTTNVPGVLYWSYAGTRQSWLSFDLSDPLMALLGSIAYGSRPNDGFVEVASARWGTEKNLNLNANHLDEINHLFGSTGSWSATGFYKGIASELKNLGL